jgi:hypothetical protein
MTHIRWLTENLYNPCLVNGWTTRYMEQVLYFRALDLFNRASFFDAHEVWEDVWRAAPPKKRSSCRD